MALITACLFTVGIEPGKAASNGATKVFGSFPKATGADENIFVLVFIPT